MDRQVFHQFRLLLKHLIITAKKDRIKREQGKASKGGRKKDRLTDRQTDKQRYRGMGSSEWSLLSISLNINASLINLHTRRMSRVRVPRPGPSSTRRAGVGMPA